MRGLGLLAGSLGCVRPGPVPRARVAVAICICIYKYMLFLMRGGTEGLGDGDGWWAPRILLCVRRLCSSVNYAHAKHSLVRTSKVGMHACMHAYKLGAAWEARLRGCEYEYVLFTWGASACLCVLMTVH